MHPLIEVWLKHGTVSRSFWRKFSLTFLPQDVVVKKAIILALFQRWSELFCSDFFLAESRKSGKESISSYLLLLLSSSFFILVLADAHCLWTSGVSLLDGCCTVSVWSSEELHQGGSGSIRSLKQSGSGRKFTGASSQDWKAQRIIKTTFLKSCLRRRHIPGEKW